MKRLAISALGLALCAAPLATSTRAQGLSAPPSGDNQRATVSQQVGPVRVSVDYSSPRVTLRGNDRRGKIWGKLVPYGLSDLGWNGCTSCPWRAGANENTVFTTSHEILVQGKPLPAGSYGLHMIPGPEEWTVIFSKNATSWGSYFYDPKEDALRVTARPARNEYREWLTYEFVEREPAKATLALEWEELRLPIAVTVPNAPVLWAEKMASELRGAEAENARSWQAAAEYSLANGVDLPRALDWAQRAVSMSGVGEESFRTLMTLSRAQAANGLAAEAAKTADRAVAHPTASPVAVHQLARQLQISGKKDDAIRMYEMNAKRFPEQWPVNVGMARASAARGDAKKALVYAKKGLPQAPDAASRKNLENLIKTLEEGKSID